jgi:hypothetical protein
VERGPANFLWASDIALLVTVAAVWLESRLLTGMMAVGVLLPELAWSLDFFLRLLTGIDLFGMNATGYMFASHVTPLFKAFSLFHVFLPLLLLWLIYRLGYDPRALPAQTLLTWVVLAVCYLFTDPERNLNWVFGIGDLPQTWMPGPLFLLLLMAAYPLCIFFPTHLLLQAAFRGRSR